MGGAVDALKVVGGAVDVSVVVCAAACGRHCMVKIISVKI